MKHSAKTPTGALIDAIHAVKPPVLGGGVALDIQKPNHIQVVVVTFELTPELVTAWGKECAKLCADAWGTQ